MIHPCVSPEALLRQGAHAAAQLAPGVVAEVLVLENGLRRRAVGKGTSAPGDKRAAEEQMEKEGR